MAATLPSPAPVSGSAVSKAVKALLKWKNSQPNSDKPQLLSSDDFMYLVVTLKTIPPKSRTNPFKIPLRHPLFSDHNSELCLLLDDRPDRLPTSKDAKSKIATDGLPISKTIKLSKLKTDYKPFEAKRKLCDSYDLLLADRRIIPLLPKHLGKHFFKKRKIPVAVDLEHKNWKEQVLRICCSAFLHLKTGTCSSVRVARSSMGHDCIVENVVAAIAGVVDTVPRKWCNVRSLHLKLSDSVALPVYQSLPDADLKEGVELGEDCVQGGGKKKKKRGREQGEDVWLLTPPSSKKASAKKGRIHQVRYMDEAADEAENVGAEEKKAEMKEAGQVELLDGGKKKKKKKNDSRAELVEADGGVKKKKARKDEPVEADKKKKVRKDEPVEADKKKKAKKDEPVEADKKKKAKKDEPVEADDGAKGKKKGSKVEPEKNVKKESKVRKVSNVAESGSAKKSRRS